MIRKYLMSALIILMILTLSSCGQRALPTGMELRDTFSENFLQEISEFSIDNTIEFFQISEIEVLRQQANDKTNRTICLIKFFNENYIGELEAELTYEYYDKGGWFLEDWTISKTSYRPLHGVTDTRIASMESYIFSFYPDAKLVSRETDLNDSLTDVFCYEIPTVTMNIGNSDLTVRESGFLKVVYRFTETEVGCFWKESYDLSAFSRRWFHWKGKWYNQASGGGPGYIYFLDINDLIFSQLNLGTIDFVLENATYGAPVTKVMNVGLYKASSNTTVEDIIPDNQTNYSDAICYFYGFFNYPKYNKDPTEPQYFACILFTEDGLIIYGRGEESINTDGKLYIKYQDATVLG